MLILVCHWWRFKKLNALLSPQNYLETTWYLPWTLLFRWVDKLEQTGDHLTGRDRTRHENRPLQKTHTAVNKGWDLWTEHRGCNTGPQQRYVLLHLQVHRYWYPWKLTERPCRIPLWTWTAWVATNRNQMAISFTQNSGIMAKAFFSAFTFSSSLHDP